MIPQQSYKKKKKKVGIIKEGPGAKTYQSTPYV